MIYISRTQIVKLYSYFYQACHPKGQGAEEEEALAHWDA